MEKKEQERAIQIEKIRIGINYEMAKIYDCPQYLDVLQDEVLIKLAVLRISFNAPVFSKGKDKEVLDNIYDAMYDLSDDLIKRGRDARNKKDKV